MKLIMLPKYEQLFCDSPQTIQEYVRCIGRRMTLNLCTHFTYKELQDDQQDIIKFWGNHFSRDNEIFANDVIGKLLELSKSYRVSIIHTQNLYMLIETALSIDVLEEISPSSSNEDIEQLFFKALLVANNIILEHQDAGEKGIEQYFLSNPSIKKVPVYILANQLAYGHYEFALNNEVAITQLYKCVCFFKFAEQHFSKHLDLYLKNKGFKDWKEYIKVLSGLVFNVVKNEKGSAFIKIPDGNTDQALECCLQLCSTTLNDYTSDYDFIELRNHPLYQWNENEFLILSNLFLAEKLYQSIYFDLNYINDNLSSGRINEFRSKISLEFSERTLLYEVLNRLFRDNIVKKTGEEIDHIVGDGGCDYYARSGSKVYLFECKDVLMQKDVKTSYDATRIMDFLYTRLVQSKGNKKAVNQLLQNIQFIRDNKIEPHRTDGAKMTIYPIIVTHHKVFDTPAINYFTNYWFQQNLKDLEIVNKDRVKPVVVINIDTLIMMKDLCRQKSIVFKDLLDEYITAVLRNEEIAMKNSYLSFADKMHDRIFSTHHFPKGSTDFAKILLNEE